ncbi:SulP family inorganic anion transporter [Chloroflexota bacterium]
MPEEQHLEDIVVMGLLVGGFMLIFGILKLGFLVRFISNAVITGPLSRLGALTILPAPHSPHNTTTSPTSHSHT